MHNIVHAMAASGPSHGCSTRWVRECYCPLTSASGRAPPTRRLTIAATTPPSPGQQNGPEGAELGSQLLYQHAACCSRQAAQVLIRLAGGFALLSNAGGNSWQAHCETCAVCTLEPSPAAGVCILRCFHVKHAALKVEVHLVQQQLQIKLLANLQPHVRHMHTMANPDRSHSGAST